jgi:hypothetical protein
MKKYKWVASSDDDGTFEDESRTLFDTLEACYNDMRNAALEKMKWNTVFDEDYSYDTDTIGYEVYFSQNMIEHISYSGRYTYRIVECPQNKEYTVSLPFSGSLNVAVEATCEEEALTKAKIAIDNLSKDDILGSIEYEQYDVHECK